MIEMRIRKGERGGWEIWRTGIWVRKWEKEGWVRKVRRTRWGCGKGAEEREQREV
jgi:hypothetical protein